MVAWGAATAFFAGDVGSGAIAPFRSPFEEPVVSIQAPQAYEPRGYGIQFATHLRALDGVDVIVIVYSFAEGEEVFCCGFYAFSPYLSRFLPGDSLIFVWYSALNKARGFGLYLNHYIEVADCLAFELRIIGFFVFMGLVPRTLVRCVIHRMLLC